jgi:hypothetical protein
MSEESVRFRCSADLDAADDEPRVEARPAVAAYSTQPPQNSDGGERSRQFAG